MNRVTDVPMPKKETLGTIYCRSGYTKKLVKKSRYVVMLSLELDSGKVIGYEVFIINEWYSFVRIVQGLVFHEVMTRELAEIHYKRLSEKAIKQKEIAI